MCVYIDIYELFELFIERVHVIKFVLFLVCFLEKWWIIIKALLLFLLVYLIYNVEWQDKYLSDFFGFPFQSSKVI